MNTSDPRHGSGATHHDSAHEYEASKYELQWHVGECYYYLRDYVEAYHYLDEYKTEIRDEVHKLGYTSGEFCALYIQTLFELGKHAEVIEWFTIAEAYFKHESLTNHMHYIRGVACTSLSVSKDTTHANFLANQRRALKYFDKIEPRFDKYDDVLAHKVTCMYFIVVVCESQSNHAEAKSVVQDYWRMDDAKLARLKPSEDTKRAMLELAFYWPKEDERKSAAIYQRLMLLREWGLFKECDDPTKSIDYFASVCLFKSKIRPRFYELFFKVPSQATLSKELDTLKKMSIILLYLCANSTHIRVRNVPTLYE